MDNDLNNRKIESLKHLIEIAPFFYCKKAVMSTINVINEMYRSGQLPPKIKGPFLKILLESGKCICGNDISLESQFRKNIEYLIKIKSSDLDDIINDSKFELENIQKLINEFRSNRNTYGKKISSIKDKLDNNSKELKEIETQIGNIDVEEVQRLARDREFWNNKKEVVNRSLITCEANSEHSRQSHILASMKHKQELLKDSRHKLPN